MAWRQSKRAPSRGHPINRKEGKELGLKVKDLDATDEESLWSLYSDFASEMRMEEEFNFIHDFIASPGGSAAIGAATPTTVFAPIPTVTGAVVESTLGSHRYEQELQVVGGRNANGVVQGTMMIMRQGWTFAPRPAPPAPVAGAATVA